MSREFGSYNAGYFDSQMEYAAEDCEGGAYEITRRWGKVLRAFAPVAYAIACAEALDSSEYAPILASIQQWSEIRAAIEGLEDYLYPFKRIMEEAVRQAVEE